MPRVALAQLAVAVAALAAGVAAQGTSSLPPFLGTGARIVETHPEGCPAGWVWYSAEEWWRRELQPISSTARDFGHIHVEGCFPHLLTMSEPFQIPVTTVLFENPGVVTDVRVTPSDFAQTKLAAAGPGCAYQQGDLGYPVFCSPRMNRAASSCSSTGGSQIAGSFDPTDTPPSNYCNWRDEVTVDPAAFDHSGLVELMVEVDQAQPTDIVQSENRMRHQRPRFHGKVDLQNSAPPNGQQADITKSGVAGLGWSHVTNYTAVNLNMAPKLPLGGIYRPWVSIRPGSKDSVPISRSIIALDVNNHLSPPTIGSLVMNQTGPFEGQVVMNLTDLLASSSAQSWHNIAFQGKSYDDSTTATNTGSLALFFEAVNGEPARCGVPIQTHAEEDVALDAAMSGDGAFRRAMQPASLYVTQDSTSLFASLRPPSPQGASTSVQLSFDLSFLSAPAGLSAASLWVYVANGNLRSSSTGGFSLVAMDATDVSTPCTSRAACTQVGQGSVPWSSGPQPGWVEVTLDPAWASQQLACYGRLAVTVGLDPDADGFLAMHRSSNRGAPILLLTPACESGGGGACGAYGEGSAGADIAG